MVSLMDLRFLALSMLAPWIVDPQIEGIGAFLK